MIVFKKILVATDFGEASAAALEYGRELATTFGATLQLLHVVGNVISQYASEFVFAAYPEVQAQVEDAAGKALNSLLTEKDRHTLRATTILRTSTAPAIAIVQCAAEEHVDLIVMGTHGRGMVGHLIAGSVAERVVRSAGCPVLTVRARPAEAG